MANLIGKIGASVFEVSNRVAIQTKDELFSEIVDRADNHESKLNTEAHQINNISGLQTALDSKADTVHTHSISDVTGLQTALNGKQDVISGYTGNVSVVVGVDFTAQAVITVEIKIVNGVITSID